MKKLLLFAVVLMLVSFTLPVNSITKKERKMLVKELKTTSADYLASVKRLSDAQLNFKPAFDKWNILQVMEHIALSEKGIMEYVQATLKQPADSSKRSEVKVTDEEFIKNVQDRSTKVNAIEMVRPTGKFKTANEAIEAFTTQRKQNIEFAQNTTEDLRNHFVSNPLWGTIDTYQLFLLMPAHTKRHTLQIEEIKATPEYPQ
jgi:hypothetical protein